MSVYAQKLAKAKEKLQAKGFKMQFVRREIDYSQMPEAGGGYPVAETRIDFYGVKTSPTQNEVQMGIFVGTELVILMPGDVCEGGPRTTDKLSFSGKLWAITAIRTVSPTELDILYKVSVKEEGADA